MKANRLNSRLLSLFLSFVLLVGCFCMQTDTIFASDSTKKVIREKSTLNLSCRYDVVQKDYDDFINDPFSYTFANESEAEMYYSYDYKNGEIVWTQKPTIKQFFEHMFDSNLDCSWEDLGVNSETISFTTESKMCIVIPLSITVMNTYWEEESDRDEIEKGGIRVKLINDEEEVIQNDYISLKGYKDGDVFNTWLYSDGGIQPKGDYKYVISTNLSDTDFSFRVKYSIVGYTEYSKSASMKKSVSKRSGNWVKIGKLGSGCPLVKNIQFSNKHVTYYDIDKNGNIFVYAKSKGTSKVTITLMNGKKYSTIVNVKPGDPNFMAYLYDYNTRNNYFVVKVYNCGSKSVTILRSGGKVVDCDYKSYDRNLKKGKSVVVKPGKTKKIKFYVNGKTTWYNYESFTLYGKIKYEGKTYQWHVWGNDSVYKKGKYWYATYWNQNDYDDWH